MNDVFLEYMIVHKRTNKDILKIGLYIMAGVFLFFTVSGIITTFIPSLSQMILVLLAGLIYILYKLITDLNLEYEYIFTNGYFDVDSIMNKSRRKRLLSVRASDFSFMGRIGDHMEKYQSGKGYKKIEAVKAEITKDSYFGLFEQGGAKMMLLFDPPSELIEHIRKYNPKNIKI